MTAMSVLGDELRRLREALGLGQQDVADALGLKSASQVSEWEDERGVSLKHWAAYAAVLRVTPEYLRQFGKPYTARTRRTKRQRLANERQGPARHASRILPAQSPDEPGAEPSEDLPSEAATLMYDFVLKQLADLPKADQTRWLEDLAEAARQARTGKQGKDPRRFGGA